jgi:hypothetical protein
VTKHVIETTDLLTKVMATPSKRAQILRDTFIGMVSRLAPFQHAFVQRLSELGVAYRGSPIVEGAGKRYFDDSVSGGDGIRSRFLLVFDNDASSSSKEAAKRLAGSFPDHLLISLSCDCGLATTQLLSGRMATSHAPRTPATESQQ